MNGSVDISDWTIERLKAALYDLGVQKETLLQNIRVVEQTLKKKIQEEAAAAACKVEEGKTAPPDESKT